MGLWTQTVQGTVETDLIKEEWETWKLAYGKKYNMDEDFRMKVWIENKAKVEEHNQKAIKGEKSYQLSMNEWSDLLHHEFVAQMRGYNDQSPRSEELHGGSYLPPAHLDYLPESVDWRKHGAVTAIRNQGRCGSCWSFSAAGALEAMHHRKTGVLTTLSEQNLIDCSSEFGNKGCNGGTMKGAFQYIKANGGIDTDKSYPYEARVGTCRYNPQYRGATDEGFMAIKAGDEYALKTAVATQGPCSVAIDDSHESFKQYSHGIYREEECSQDRLNHGVLVIGYGVEDGSAYWLVKNSWGISWGMEGYFKLARDENNMCGVASQASYPIV